MAIRIKEQIARQVETECEEIKKSDGLPFRDLLTMERMQDALEKAGIEFRDRIYSPMVTLWAFLSQVMSKDGSCDHAVACVIADRASRNQKTCSPNTGSYCTARQRLPLGVMKDLTRGIGQDLDTQAPEEWKWHGRSVKVVDGSTQTMADTPENQKEFPQSRNQKPGLGFPIVRFVMIFSLAVGTVLDAAIGACRGKGTGEQNLFRKLLDCLKTGDILLGDRLYDCYRDIVVLKSRGVDVVVGRKQSRAVDFRRGTRLGPGDHLVMWYKPKYDKTRFGSREQWLELPDQIQMREIRIRVYRKGFKTRTVDIVTTLLNAKCHGAKDVGQLFAKRWHCELDIRSIKVALGMDHLRCQTPEMVEKELWAHFLAYNLIRTRMAQAAELHGVLPLELSFTCAKNFLNEFQPYLGNARGAELARLEREMLLAMSKCRVGKRPGRKEPRATKKRPQKHPNLTQPRAEARKGLPA